MSDPWLSGILAGWRDGLDAGHLRAAREWTAGGSVTVPPGAEPDAWQHPERRAEGDLVGRWLDAYATGWVAGAETGYGQGNEDWACVAAAAAPVGRLAAHLIDRDTARAAPPPPARTAEEIQTSSWASWDLPITITDEHRADTADDVDAA